MKKSNNYFFIILIAVLVLYSCEKDADSEKTPADENKWITTRDTISQDIVFKNR